MPVHFCITERRGQPRVQKSTAEVRFCVTRARGGVVMQKCTPTALPSGS